MKNKIIPTLINLHSFTKKMFFPCIFSYFVFKFFYSSDVSTWAEFSKVLVLVFSFNIRLAHPTYIILCPLLWSQLIIVALALTKYQKARIYFIILQLFLVVSLNLCIFYLYNDLPPSYEYLFKKFISLRILIITHLVNVFFAIIFMRALDDDYNIREVCFSLLVLFLVTIVWLFLLSLHYFGMSITIIFFFFGCILMRFLCLCWLKVF